MKVVFQNKLSRSIGRIIFHLGRTGLRFIDAVAPRIFMRLYVPLLRIYGVRFKGTPRYISTKVKFDDFDRVVLGDRVVVSENVIFLTHDYSLTTALRSVGKDPKTDLAFVKDISVGDNVFIGMGSLILPGTVIERDVIVGAGSVVRGTIRSDSIVLGNPAQPVALLSTKADVWAEKINSSFVMVDRK